jgi:threonine dehydratase
MATPQESYPKLAQELGFPHEVYFKREDLHEYGSHKGRSIPHMIDEKVQAGARHFVISSSGNAALAAGLHIQKLNKAGADIILEILAGKSINSKKQKKLEALKDGNILFSIQDRPLQALFMKIQQDPSIQSLRQSNDDSALVGYNELAKELAQIPDLKVIFMGTSSGTTAQALAEYFKNKKKNVEVHIVQTSSCHPISDSFIENYSSMEKSIADAITDITAIRKEKVESLAAGGWIASNEEIVAAQDIVKSATSLSISTNSALSVVGLMQAVYTGKDIDGAVVCMICGD